MPHSTAENIVDDVWSHIAACLDERTLGLSCCVSRRTDSGLRALSNVHDDKWRARMLADFGVHCDCLVSANASSPKQLYKQLRSVQQKQKERALLEQRARAMAAGWRIPLDAALQICVKG